MTRSRTGRALIIALGLTLAIGDADRRPAVADVAQAAGRIAPAAPCDCKGGIRARQIRWLRLLRLASDPAAAARRGIVMTK